jgi:hypothetical protein
VFFINPATGTLACFCAIILAIKGFLSAAIPITISWQLVQLPANES